MANLNKVIIAGNLTRDPELRVTPKGTAICQFGLAINREFKGDGGEKKKETTFVDVEAWQKTGELVAKYLTKGSGALIFGRLKIDEWEDKQSGQKRSKLKIVAEEVQFLGGRESAPKGDDAPKPSAADREWAQRTGQDSGGAKSPAVAEEDVPFLRFDTLCQ